MKEREAMRSELERAFKKGFEEGKKAAQKEAPKQNISTQSPEREKYVNRDCIGDLLISPIQSCDICSIYLVNFCSFVNPPSPASQPSPPSPPGVREQHNMITIL
jgi:hypothetical protein